MASTGPLQPGSDPTKADTDGDTFYDNTEVYAGTNPNLSTSFPVLTAGLDLLAYWSFNDSSNPAVATDAIYRAKGTMTSGAAYTAAGGGRTGQPGDTALDLGTVKAGQKLVERPIQRPIEMPPSSILRPARIRSAFPSGKS